MILETIKKRIEFKFGKPILYSKDCESLAAFMNKKSPNNVSAATLKRVFGIVTRTTKLRKYTLDTLAQFAGFADLKSIINGDKVFENKQGGDYDNLYTCQLKHKQIIELEFQNNECISFEYLNDFYLRVVNSCLKQFKKDDIVKIIVFEINYPLICEKVVRGQKDLHSISTDKNLTIKSIRTPEVNVLQNETSASEIISYQVNENQEIVSASSSFVKLLNYNEDEIIGKTIDQYMSHRTKMGIPERNIKLQNGQTINDYYGGFISKEGHLIELIGIIIPEFRFGRYCGVRTILKMANDIFAENSFVGSPEKAVSEKLPSTIILGFDWTILFINESLTEQLFHTKVNMIGRKIIDVFPGFVNSDIYTKYKLCLEKRKRIEFYETFTHENGVTRLYNIVAEPVDEGMLAFVRRLTKE